MVARLRPLLEPELKSLHVGWSDFQTVILKDPTLWQHVQTQELLVTLKTLTALVASDRTKLSAASHEFLRSLATAPAAELAHAWVVVCSRALFEPELARWAHWPSSPVVTQELREDEREFRALAACTTGGARGAAGLRDPAR